MLIACRPTAIGSVNAACSLAVPRGTGTSSRSDSNRYSAKPPGTSLDQPTGRDGSRASIGLEQTRSPAFRSPRDSITSAQNS